MKVTIYLTLIIPVPQHACQLATFPYRGAGFA